jgi:hypothetical protein
MRSEEQPKNSTGLKVINGNFGKKKPGLGDLLQGILPPVNSEPPELSEKEILMKVLKILDGIEVYEKEWTGGRRKKRSTIKTRIFGGRIPTALINEIHEFQGSNTYHLEKALRLYVKVMRAGSWQS